MDIEELTKTQMLLLTLLVSFVTSIATGIVTVTLLDEAPPIVTNTVNRVVEHTVERVSPQKTQSAQVIEREKTVVVDKSEHIAQTIEKADDGVVWLYEIQGGQEDEKVKRFLALGSIISDTGTVVTTHEVASLGDFENVEARTRDGLTYSVAGIDQNTQNRNKAFHFVSLQADEETAFTPVSIVDTTDIDLGQTVVALGGTQQAHVSRGILTSLPQEPQDDAGGSNEGGDGATSSVRMMATDIDSKHATAGMPLFNTTGDMIGMYAGNMTESGDELTFRAVSELHALFNTHIGE